MSLFGQNRPLASFGPALLVVAAVGLLCGGLSGCVQRRMTIRSNPPGALVYVDDNEIGPTPVSASFTYYGKRKIRLVKDGYETLTVMQEIPTPWYEYVPLDFISENLVPGKIRDQRVLDYQLRPQMVVPTDQLLSRAEELRRSSHGSAVAPMGPPNAPPQPQPAAPDGYYQPPATFPPAPPPGAPEMIPAPSGIGGQPPRPVSP
jgi:hypothetical protein